MYFMVTKHAIWINTHGDVFGKNIFYLSTVQNVPANPGHNLLSALTIVCLTADG